MALDPCEMFKVLGVETRVKIIELIKAKGSLGAKEIAGTLGITPAAVSQHLKVLKHAGLVKNERKGYWIPYSIDEEAMENCRCSLIEVCTCGCEGARNYRKKDLTALNKESLKKYEDELKNELKIVKARINELKSRKK